MKRWRGEPPRRHDGRWWERLREFSTPLELRERWTGTESEGTEGEGGFFPLLAALSTANENLLPLPYLPACLPACQPASLPACLSASQLACHRYLTPLYPPLFRSGFTEIFPSPLFSWWPGSDWREIRN